MFDAVYVINLRASAERWRATAGVLAEAGVENVVRWEAIDGRALDEAALRRLQAEGLLAADLSRFDPACRAGEIGCALSHTAAIREIAARGFSCALVLEDDIALAGDTATWRARVRRALGDLPGDWDLFYLYRCFDVAPRVKRVSRRVVVPWTPLGGAAYALSRRGAATLARLVAPVATAIDRCFVQDVIRLGHARAFAASPRLVLPGPHPSIIDAVNRTKPWLVDGINRPPEYWPDAWLPGLGEQTVRRRRALWLGLAAAAGAAAAAARLMAAGSAR